MPSVSTFKLMSVWRSRLGKIVSRGGLYRLQHLILLVVGTKRTNDKQCSSTLKRWSCTLTGSSEKNKLRTGAGLLR